jgi:hypothetical protein
LAETEQTYEVVEGKVGQIRRLNAEILERLCAGIDHLVDELALHLVGRHGRPPEVLVQVKGKRLKHGLGEVDVAAVLDDFPVDNLGDFDSRVLLGSVKLVCLASSKVIVEHTLERTSDINGLKKKVSKVLQIVLGCAYVNWPVSLLHVVRSKEVSDASKLVKQIILISEQRSRADNSGFRVDFPHKTLTPTLGAEEFRRRVFRGVKRGHVNEPIDVVLGYGLRNAFRSVNVDILVGEVLRRVVAPDKVVDNVRMAHTFFDRLCVAKVVFLIV